MSDRKRSNAAVAQHLNEARWWRLGESLCRPCSRVVNDCPVLAHHPIEQSDRGKDLSQIFQLATRRKDQPPTGRLRSFQRRDRLGIDGAILCNGAIVVAGHSQIAHRAISIMPATTLGRSYISRPSCSTPPIVGREGSGSGPGLCAASKRLAACKPKGEQVEPSPDVGWRKVGPAEERSKIRRQKDRQRPTSAAAHQLNHSLIELIEIRALLAIDFDIDEKFVHQLRRFRTLEAFMRHHVAPMAGGIANREKDWLVQLASELKRLL